MECKNKGTGAGGANTNANGLSFEDMASLEEYFSVISELPFGLKIQFNGFPKEFIYLKKKEFIKWTRQLPVGEYNDIPKLHGTKEPDGCFINRESKQIIILEKKFQNGGGSVAEKLQTPVNKIRNLSRRYVSYKIFYIYWLSDWFKDNAKAELLDLVEDKIPYFIGLSYDIKMKIVEQINNCK